MISIECGARFSDNPTKNVKGAQSDVIDGLVSVITPCYNGGKYLSETIESVLAQSYGQWEMIIVDDGSSDDSADIAGVYAARDGRVRLLRQRNRGSAAARNSGIRSAEGRYIALLDADDLWDPRFLERQIDFMRRKDAVCVCCGYDRIDGQSRPVMRPTVPPERITTRDMRVMNRIGCLTGLYDSARYGKVFLHEELKSVRDDYAYWYDIVALEDRACGNPEILAHYRVLQDSVTGNKLNLVAKQFRFYRGYLKQNVLTASVNTLRWGLAGLRKFSQ